MDILDIDHAKRLISLGDLPNSQGGIYNPGAVLFGGKIVIVCRRESNYEAYKGRYFDYPVYPTLLIQNPVTDVVERIATLEQVGFFEAFGKNHRIEDFRPFVFNDEIFVGHVVIYEKAPGFNVTIQVISRLDLEKNTLTLSSIPKLPVPTNIVEKNWVYMDEEDGGQLHCIQNLYCPSVFELESEPSGCNSSSRSAFSASKEGAGWVMTNCFRGWKIVGQKELISLSANPIWVDDKLLIFYHIKTPAYQYLNYACILGEAQPNTPFLASNKAQGKSSGVVYVMSAVYLKKRQLIRVYFGEGDAHSSYLDFESKKFMKSINPQKNQ